MSCKHVPVSAALWVALFVVPRVDAGEAGATTQAAGATTQAAGATTQIAGATPQAAAYEFVAAANIGDIGAMKAAATPNADEEALRILVEMLKAKYAFRDALEKKFGLKAIHEFRPLATAYAYQLVTPEEELDGVKNGTVRTVDGRTTVEKQNQPGQVISMILVDGEWKVSMIRTPEQVAKSKKRTKEMIERFKKRTENLPTDTSKDIYEFFNKPSQR